MAESNISTTFMRVDHARLVGRPCAMLPHEHEVLTVGPNVRKLTSMSNGTATAPRPANQKMKPVYRMGYWKWNADATSARWAWLIPEGVKVVDRQYPDYQPRHDVLRQSEFRCRMAQDETDPRLWTLTTCGGALGGTRHRYNLCQSEALAAAEAWLARRYKAVEVAS